ncbi:MAG: RHS repeat-associated core domain-containing protein, partial [Caldilineaceae bacterium]
MTSYEGTVQTVNATFPAHAIKKSGYSYDGNGNLISRAGNTLVWNHENRLQEVKNGSTTIESYLYDPDGQRVKKTAGSTSTYYVNQFYEKSGTTVTQYYYFNGQRIAMKQGSTIYYLHSDHLGGVAMSTAGGTTPGSTSAYNAYGSYRFGGAIPTDHKFTGQKLDAATGLYYFNSRYYDRDIGTFISPDTIVPDATNLFDYNRYMMVRGNPLRYSDPTGHDPLDANWEAEFEANHGRSPTDHDRRDRLFSLMFLGSGSNGAWTQENWSYYT